MPCCHCLQDFHLPLMGGPTEQEVIDRRTAAFAEVRPEARAAACQGRRHH
jgi:hypothetical protein